MAGLSDFALDFGISISKETLGRVTKLAAGIATVKTFIDSCMQSAEMQNRVLRENAVRLGGFTNALNEIDKARKKLLDGKSFFGIEDQIRGMENLRRIGVDAEKNFEFFNKAAHATGKSFEQFSGMVSSAIAGNAHALVEAGFMTQRASRIFDKYQANTVQRQQAILNFLKTHKGLMNVIKNDFSTVEGYMKRVKETINALGTTLIGKPNDPESLWGSLIAMAKRFSEVMVSITRRLEKYFWSAGTVLGWFVRQATHFMDWLVKKTKPYIDAMWGLSDSYKEQIRSFIVWLEFWKIKVIAFLREYQKEIKLILLLFGAFKLVKWITPSMLQFGSWLSAIFTKMGALRKLQLAYYSAFKNSGVFGGKILSRIASWAVYLPKFMQKGYLWLMRIIAGIGAIKALVIAALVAIFAYLYDKSENFRGWVNSAVKMFWETIKLVGNLIIFVINTTMNLAKKLWNSVLEPTFSTIKGWFEGLFSEDSKFMKCLKKVGDFISEWILEPLGRLFNWIGGGLASANTALAEANRKDAAVVTTGSVEGDNWYTKLAGGLSGNDFSEVDKTNYGRKAVGAVKNTYNKYLGSGDTNNSYVTNKVDIHVEGGADPEETAKAVKKEFDRKTNQEKLQEGK